MPVAGRVSGEVCSPANTVRSALARRGLPRRNDGGEQDDTHGRRHAALWGHGSAPHRRPAPAARQRPRVRRARTASPRDGVGRGAALPDGPPAEAGRPRADGHPVPRGAGWRGHVGRGLLPLHRGTGPGRSGHRAQRRRAQRPRCGTPAHVRHRGPAAALPGPARDRAGPRRVGADRAHRRQRRGGHADHRAA